MVSDEFNGLSVQDYTYVLDLQRMGLAKTEIEQIIKMSESDKRKAVYLLREQARMKKHKEYMKQRRRDKQSLKNHLKQQHLENEKKQKEKRDRQNEYTKNYRKENYSCIQVFLDKEYVAAFKEKVRANMSTQTDVIRMMIDTYMEI